MDLVRKQLIEKNTMFFSSDVERLIRTAKKDVLLDILSSKIDYGRWHMQEIYRVNELRSIALELWKGELK